MGMLEDGEVWLRDQRKAYLSKEVTYQRGAVTLALQATQGETSYDKGDFKGVQQRVVTVDWIFDLADLGALGEPQEGDRVLLDGRIYSAMSLDGKRCFKQHGRDGLSVRLHTKEVAV